MMKIEDLESLGWRVIKTDDNGVKTMQLGDSEIWTLDSFAESWFVKEKGPQRQYELSIRYFGIQVYRGIPSGPDNFIDLMDKYSIF